MTTNNLTLDKFTKPFREYSTNRADLASSKRNHYFFGIAALVVGIFASVIYYVLTQEITTLGDLGFKVNLSIEICGGVGIAALMALGVGAHYRYTFSKKRETEDVNPAGLMNILLSTLNTIRNHSTRDAVEIIDGKEVRKQVRWEETLRSELRSILDTYTAEEWKELIIKVIQSTSDENGVKSDKSDSTRGHIYKLLLDANPEKFIVNYFEEKEEKQFLPSEQRLIKESDRLLIEGIIGEALDKLHDTHWANLVSSLSEEKKNPEWGGLAHIMFNRNKIKYSLICLQRTLPSRNRLDQVKDFHYFLGLTALALGILTTVIVVSVAYTYGVSLKVSLIAGGAGGGGVAAAGVAAVFSHYKHSLPPWEKRVGPDALARDLLTLTSEIIEKPKDEKATEKERLLKTLRPLLQTYTNREWGELIVKVYSNSINASNTLHPKSERAKKRLAWNIYALLIKADPVKFINNYYQAKSVGKAEVWKSLQYFEKGLFTEETLGGLKNREWRKMIPAWEASPQKAELYAKLEAIDKQRFDRIRSSLPYAEPLDNSPLAHFVYNHDKLISAKKRRLLAIVLFVVAGLVAAFATYLLLPKFGIISSEPRFAVTGSVAGAFCCIIFLVVAYYMYRIGEKEEATDGAALAAALESDENFSLKELVQEKHWTLARLKEILQDFTGEQWQQLIKNINKVKDKENRKLIQLILLASNPVEFMLNHNTIHFEKFFLDTLKSMNDKQWDEILFTIDYYKPDNEPFDPAELRVINYLIYSDSAKFLKAFQKRSRSDELDTHQKNEIPKAKNEIPKAREKEELNNANKTVTNADNKAKVRKRERASKKVAVSAKDKGDVSESSKGKGRASEESGRMKSDKNKSESSVSDKKPVKRNSKGKESESKSSGSNESEESKSESSVNDKNKGDGSESSKGKAHESKSEVDDAEYESENKSSSSSE
jgi:hypothetical protein